MRQLSNHLFLFEDTCNVYVIVGDDNTIAIDFGSGNWLAEFAALGLPPLQHIFLTHHHADQCGGLSHLGNDPMTQSRNDSIQIHAPPGEQDFLSPEGIAEFWRTRRDGGVPRSYSVLPLHLAEQAAPVLNKIRYDMAGWTDLFWGVSRVRFVHTPGHGPNAVSIIVDVDGRQVVFCGDAAHAGGTVWQPYHLEWDHWTGAGALAAWQGIERLRGIGMDLLCPAHGPVIEAGIRPALAALSRRLLNLVRAKGQIAMGEKDAYALPLRILACGARQVLPHLYQFAENSYLLVSASGEALLIDPWSRDLDQLDALLAEIGHPHVTAATATHYHLDHSDGLPVARAKYGAVVWLHPQVAAPLRDPGAMDVPWLVKAPVLPDYLWPAAGDWQWNEYAFRVGHYPGQTWWHAAFMARIDGRKVLFGGDTFQPPSRWNGTGGFCACNGSRFYGGFVHSAQMSIDWRPDLVAAGHGTFIHFNRAYYRKVMRWAGWAEQVVMALCPTGSLAADYYRWPVTS